MPVIAMWKCDRDGAMFENKKDADAHDKMLELAEGFMTLIEQQLHEVGEEQAEAFGLLLARNKEVLIQACKGKPELLSSISNSSESEKDLSLVQSESKVSDNLAASDEDATSAISKAS